MLKALYVLGTFTFVSVKQVGDATVSRATITDNKYGEHNAIRDKFLLQNTPKREEGSTTEKVLARTDSDMIDSSDASPR